MASVESCELVSPISIRDDGIHLRVESLAVLAAAVRAQSYLWRGQAQVLVAASYFHSLFLSALHLSSYSLMSS